MDSYKIEAIARIQCDIGIDNVIIRPISFKGWAIVHPISNCQAEIIYEAKTEDECRALLAEASKKDS